MNTELPLQSTFAHNLAMYTALSEACKVLDNPLADRLSKMVAKSTIQTILDVAEHGEA